MDIKRRTEHMREQPLFQGMGFSKILEFSRENQSIKIEYIAEPVSYTHLTLPTKA